MASAEYQREWRAKNKDRLRILWREYYHTKSRFARKSRRENPNIKCELCEVRLVSTFGTKNGRKYCDDCRIVERKKLHNIYHRRAYAKRVGKKLEPITQYNLIK